MVGSALIAESSEIAQMLHYHCVRNKTANRHFTYTPPHPGEVRKLTTEGQRKKYVSRKRR